MTVLHGDCLEVMPTLDADSVDAIVCDPPYGLSFMGKQWDHGVPGEPFWREALRVAKPGAHLVAFGGTRTYHRLAVAIEDAGWEIRDCLSWLYGSGFPKSHNGPWGGTALKPAWEPIILARKPLVGTVAANVTQYGTGGLNVDGCRIGRTDDDVSGWSKTGSVASENRSMSGANYAREPKPDASGRWPANVVLDEEAAGMLDAQTGNLAAGGSRTRAHGKTGSGATFVLGGEHKSYGDPGGASRFFFVAREGQCDNVSGAELSSSQSNGRGDSAPSGAVTRDNLEGWPHGNSPVGPASTADCGCSTQHHSLALNAGQTDSTDTTPTTPTLCASCGSAHPATDESTSPASVEAAEGVNVRVSGTRFLYTAKASRREREAGLEGMPLRGRNEVYGDGFSTATKLDPAIGHTVESVAARPQVANNHPTVKPIAVMRWLCRLVTPPNGLILDPFTGSGTTGCAAVLEGFRFVGIERKAEYAEIARKRIAHWQEPTLFSEAV